MSVHLSIRVGPPQAQERCLEQVVGDVKLDVMHISQNDHKSCATTSIAMVISHYEHLNEPPLNKEIVWNISGTDEAIVHQFGNDMEGLQRIATHYGYRANYIEYMQVSDVERFLDRGMPVMLNITVSKESTATHAVLVIGYNKRENIFYINDPADRQNTSIRYSDLEDRWSAYLSFPRGMSHHSGFIVYPKTL